jgi:crossover junction endodeoxyribonuclease RusA
VIEIAVYGSAKPAGALQIGTTRDGRRFLHHRDSGQLSHWKRAITAEAAEAMESRAPTRGAVKVEIRFYVARPQAHFGKRGLRPTALAHPIKRSVGDVDKLARAVLDSLTGVVFADDSQVVDLRVRKRYADERAVAAEIKVLEFNDELDVLTTPSGPGMEQVA